MKAVLRYEEEIEMSKEGPFPAKVLLSEEDTELTSVKTGKLAIGQEIAVHSHKESSQLEYYPQGRATLFLEGEGDKEIRSGTFMFAPKGVKHGISNVTEELVIFSVFIPALF